MARIKVVVFDVIETLLDLNSLRPEFQRLLGGPDDLDRWFTQLIQSAVIATILDRYEDFGTIARHALEMVAGAKRVTLADGDRTALLSGIRKLPPHRDVRPALERLKKTGLRLATLTNSTRDVAEAQLTNAGIRPYFEKVLSVESVRRFKPAPEVYRTAARELGIDVGEMRLVAAHDWDVTGAIRAGARAAFVARPGKVLGPLSEKPDIIAPDLVAAVSLIAVADAA
jgi:2-haloacid dehalogenase